MFMMNGYRGLQQKGGNSGSLSGNTISMLHREQGAGSEIKILIGRRAAAECLSLTKQVDAIELSNRVVVATMCRIRQRAAAFATDDFDTMSDISVAYGLSWSNMGQKTTDDGEPLSDVED
jgi:hypothetical protein